MVFPGVYGPELSKWRYGAFILPVSPQKVFTYRRQGC